LTGTKLTPTSPPEQIHRVLDHIDAHANGLHEGTPTFLPGDDDEARVEITTVHAPGVNGHNIALHLFRRADAIGPLPAVVYLHGGSMIASRTRNPTHDRWCKSLALAGVVAIALDFRNAWDAAAHVARPFPAGLDDCVADVLYLHQNRAMLGLQPNAGLVLPGESGGANPALATALRAKREGWCDDRIAGVYALSPFISNMWHAPRPWLLRNLPSVVENDGYFVESTMSTLMAHAYTPAHSPAARDPLAWPYHASTSDLAGLPPHVVSVAELDLLRDEGLAYARKLRAAGVDVVALVAVGATHACETFRHFVPELHLEAVESIAALATRVTMAMER
jgi:acetyl esterase/lipase